MKPDLSHRRRQARGQRRIDQILTVAEQVFADVGYEATTTNAIAARAGMSPGSLYQFFENKEAIAAGLAARYLDRLEHGFDHFPKFDAFHLELWSQQHAMLEHGSTERLYVLGQHEIALLEPRKRPRCGK